MARTITCAAVVGLLLLTQVGSGYAQQASTSGQESAPSLKIGSGDLIEITVYGQTDLSGRFRVNEKGDALVPLLGTVHVAGMTADETAMDLNEHYIQAEILSSGKAHVTVFIAEYATQGIIVNGEVKSPGLYPALGVRMLNDVMTAAGGVSPTASSKVIITHKNASESPLTVDYDPEAMKPVVPQIQIFPGDTITVPRAGIVYVAGNVTRSGGYVLEGQRTLTVESVMALAGWGGHAASLNHAHLVRTLADGSREDIQLSINQIFKGKAPDVALKDGDVLYIPTSNSKLATQQAMNAALGIGTSIVIFRAAR